MSKTFTVLMAMVVALPSMVAPTIATAGAYVGIGIGGDRAESSLKKLDLVPSLATDTDVIGSNPSYSNSQVSIEATVGWSFNERFSVEVGYVDFGEFRDNYALPDSPPGCAGDVGTPGYLGCQSRQWTATMSAHGIQAFVMGSVPVSEMIDAYLKLGAINWNADYSGYEQNVAYIPGPPIGPRNPSTSYSDSGTDLAAAMGFTLKTGTPFSVRTEFAYYDMTNTDYVWVAQLMGIYTF